MNGPIHIDIECRDCGRAMPLIISAFIASGETGTVIRATSAPCRSCRAIAEQDAVNTYRAHTALEAQP